MPPPSSLLLLRILTVTVLLLTIPPSTTSIQEHELLRSLSVLQSRGYSLFSNAIATSDIIYDVLSSNSSSTFTFFAPTDSSLFTLDMTGSASEYTDTLRCHIIPHRLNINQLRTSASGSGLFESMVKGKEIKVQVWEDDVITVNGVVVALPGLYYTRNVAVHGLGGILNEFNHPPPPPPAVIRRRRPVVDSGKKPQSQMNITANHTAASPTPLPSPPPPPPLNSSSNYGVQPLLPGSPPPPLNSSSNYGVWRLFPGSPPVNSSLNNGSYSPVINQTLGPSPVNFSDVAQPPIDSMIFPEEVGYEAPPIDSKISPGVGYEAVVPEFTEMNDDGYISRRLIEMDDDDDDVEEEKGVRNNRGALIVVSPENIAGVMEMLQADFEKWDGKIFDCLLTDELGHVSIPHGYLYTRQQSHSSTMPSCAGLHEFLHLQKSVEF